MANKHHKPEKIVAKLRQVEVLQGQGMSVADAPLARRVYGLNWRIYEAEFFGIIDSTH